MYILGMDSAQSLVPCPGCIAATSRDDLSTVHTFRVEDCALAMIRQLAVCDVCPRCGQTDFPPENTIPDLLLLDVNPSLHLGPTDLQFDLEGCKLGQGGEGAVYLGVLHHETQVAIKQNSIMQYVREAQASNTSDSGRESATGSTGSVNGQRPTSMIRQDSTGSSHSTEGAALTFSSGKSSGSGDLSRSSCNAQLHLDFKVFYR